MSLDTFLMTIEQKMDFWTSEVINPNRTKSYVELRHSLNGIGSRYNPDQQRKLFIEEYFQKMPIIFEKEESQIVETYIDYALPYCEDTKWKLKQYKKVMEDTTEFISELAKNKLLKIVDNLNIQIEILAHYE